MGAKTFFSRCRFPLFVTAMMVLAGGVLGDRPRAQQNSVSVRDIVDDTADEAVPGFLIGDASVVEGNGGAANATFTVTLVDGGASGASVRWATADDTATAPGVTLTSSTVLTIPTAGLSVAVLPAGQLRSFVLHGMTGVSTRPTAPGGFCCRAATSRRTS